MDRRSFISTVSGVTLGPTLLKGGMGWSQETGPKLKIGFLGAAYSHAAPKLKLLQKHSDFDLVGAWDDSPKVREALTKQGVPVLSREEVLSRSQVIAVESVVRDHARYAKMALSAGRHVHLEKPPSLNMEDFREVVRIAREKHLVLQGGYQYRHSPPFNAVIEAARKGWLGEVYMVRATMNNQLAAVRSGANSRAGPCSNWAAT